MFVEHSVVSFCHVRCDANKVEDVIANAGMDRGTGHQRGLLEDFRLEDWSQIYR